MSTLGEVSSVGPDGISGHFIYQLRYVIYLHLWTFYWRSLDEGVFSDIWKIRHTIFIFKSGIIFNVKNYRLIFILLHLLKTLFKFLVLHRITLGLNSILIDEQHSFWPGGFIVIFNVAFCGYIYGIFKNRSLVDVIYTDIAKAFIFVDYDNSLSILTALEIGFPLIFWLKSFLHIELNGLNCLILNPVSSQLRMMSSRMFIYLLLYLHYS